MSNLLHWSIIEAPSSWWSAKGKAGQYSIQSIGFDKVLAFPNGTSAGFETVDLAKERADEFELRFIATQKPTTSKFWMVYGLNQGAPNYRHHSLSSAQAEAKRLSKNNHGITFVVLEAVDAYQAEEPKVHQFDIGAPSRCDDDSIPF